MTEAAETPDATPATGAEIEQIVATIQSSAGTPLALVKMQMALSDMEALNKLAADEATVAQAEELAKAWIEGDDPLRKAFASHWVARARVAARGAARGAKRAAGRFGEQAAGAARDAGAAASRYGEQAVGAARSARESVDRFGERVGRKGADLYAGTSHGKRKLAGASGKARMQAESEQRLKTTPRSERGPGPRGFLPEGTKVTPASSGPGFRGFLPEGSTIKLRPGQQTQGQFEAKRAALRDKSISDAGRAAGRQAESGLRERFRQTGAKVGRYAARGAAFAGGAAAGAGAAYAGSRRWDSSKHNRGDGGKFSR